MKADFSKIISDSIKITKSNKKLWVFGLVLATLGAGANFNMVENFADTSREKVKQKQENTIDYSFPNPDTNLSNSNLLTSASQLPQVLGTATNTLSDLVKTIPLSFYGAFGILLIASILLGMAVGFYGQAWSTSGLIHGIANQNSGQTLSLYQMSDKGKLNAVEVIKIKIFPGLLFTLAIMASTLVLVIPAMLLGDAGKIILIFLGIIFVVVVIIASILLAGSVQLGILAINMESLKWKAGFKRGFVVFKTYFFDILVMSVINCFAGCVFGVASLIALVILGVIGVATVFGVYAFPPFLVVAGPIIFLYILASILLMGIIGAISAVFKQSTWVLLYKQLTEEPHGSN